jgi:hypothetical protein
MDTLLPDTTVGFVSIMNSPRLQEQWNKTQLGKLMTQAEMKPFEADFKAQMQAQWSALTDRLGIHLEDLEGVSTGESSLSLLEPKPGAAATCLLLDVSNNPVKAAALLAKARKGLAARGAKETIIPVGRVFVSLFDVPLPQNQQAAAGQGGAAGAAATEPTIYFLTNNLFGACDDLSVVRDILARLANGMQVGSLSEVTAYRMVMKRCAADAPNQIPSLRWCVFPVGYAEATRAATPPEKRRKGKTIIEIMRNQGYGAVKALGGYVDVAPDGYQILHRTSIYAPPPYVESMKMFVFPNGANFTPQPWVGRDIAAYFTVYIDILNAFDNFGPLYDEMMGEKGLWKQTLEGMITDPGGPQIDLRKELIANLGQRVTMVADYNLPITTTSERLVWAIECKNPAAVAKALEKCVKNDATIKKRVINGYDVWEIVEEEDTGVPQLKVDVPSLTPKKDDGKPKADDKDEDQEKESHFLPHGAITVAHGELFIATHIDFLAKILKPLDKDRRLATQPEFQKVWNVTFGALGIRQQSSRSFAWTDRWVEPTYELVRQGKMPQSESLLARTLNTMASTNKKGGPRQQRIDGSKLPDFSVVRKSLGPSTAAMSSEANGWFIKGVLMTK